MTLEIGNIPTGQPVLIMTFGMHYAGEFAGVRDGSVLLRDARLVSEVGRMVTFTSGKAVSGKDGHYSEPIYDDVEMTWTVPLDVVQSYGPVVRLPVRS